jgi:hypothetical protein
MNPPSRILRIIHEMGGDCQAFAEGKVADKKHAKVFECMFSCGRTKNGPIYWPFLSKPSFWPLSSNSERENIGEWPILEGFFCPKWLFQSFLKDMYT